MLISSSNCGYPYILKMLLITTAYQYLLLSLTFCGWSYPSELRTVFIQECSKQPKCMCFPGGIAYKLPEMFTRGLFIVEGVMFCKCLLRLGQRKKLQLQRTVYGFGVDQLQIPALYNWYIYDDCFNSVLQVSTFPTNRKIFSHFKQTNHTHSAP